MFGVSFFSSFIATGVTCLYGMQERDLPAAGWPHLKHLQVSNHAMQPAVLARLTALEQLELRNCHLLAYPDRVSGFEGFEVDSQTGFRLGSSGLKPLASLI
jgi:hypothetical protein